MELIALLSNLGTFATLDGWIRQKVQETKEKSKQENLNNIDEEFKKNKLGHIKDEYELEKIDNFITKHSSNYKEISMKLCSYKERESIVNEFFLKNSDLSYMRKDISNIINMYIDTLNEYLNEQISLEGKIVYNKLEMIESKVDKINEKAIVELEVLNSDIYKRAMRQADNKNYVVAIELLEQLECMGTNNEQKIIDFNIGLNYLKYALECGKSEVLLEKSIKYLLVALKYTPQKDDEDDIYIYRVTSRAYEEYAMIRDSVVNYEKALIYQNEAINKDEKKNYFFESMLDKARIYESMSSFADVKDGKKYLDNAIYIYNKLYNTKDIILTEEHAFILLNNIGRALNKKSEIDNDDSVIDEALQYYLEAKKVPYCSAEKNPSEFALLQNNIGNIYSNKVSLNIGEVKYEAKIAFEHYNRALNVYDKDNYRREYSQTANNIAALYFNLYKRDSIDKDFEIGIEYVNKAFKYRNIGSDPKGYAATSRVNGLLYFQKGSKIKDTSLIDDACTQLNNALCIYKKEVYQKYYCETRYYYAKCLKVKADIKRDVELYKEAKKVLIELLRIEGIEYNLSIYEIILEYLIKIILNIDKYCANIDDEYDLYYKQIEFLNEINAQKYGLYIYYNFALILYNKYIDNDDFESLNEARKYLNEYMTFFQRETISEENIEKLLNLKERLDKLQE